MIPVVSIVGKSSAGKTTLIEKIIPELVRRGYRVGTIKHDVHGFEIDHEGKDSWRHKHAGARSVVLSSPWKVALVEDVERDHEIAELRDRYLRDVDIILSEGYKRNPHPKIEVHRAALKEELLCGRADNLLAVATDEPLGVEVPSFGLDDASGIVDLIEKLFLLRDDGSG
ncbi:MAG: molybdopterin-guanine dinucleotide biosynthesis protein B [Deltaproteobacteria bacterium]|nr:molybdopterin-guanine dinucleotide biosynthesis protein B [Deltaproteobacteria bacterium]